MGKKSRHKKERRLAREAKRPPPADIHLLNWPSGSVYRFFSEEKHARDFANGSIWISTLGACRAYENPQRGDPDEGSQFHHIIDAEWRGDNPQDVESASRALMNLGPRGRVKLRNVMVRSHLQDAFVICTTLRFSPEAMGENFGRFCVEIRDPPHFLVTVTEKLEEIRDIRTAIGGKVIYRKRYFNEGSSPGPLGFVKPPDLYSRQEEFRFLWLPWIQRDLAPFVLHCPEVRDICRVIS